MEKRESQSVHGLRGAIIAQPRARRPRSDDGYERSSEVSNMCATLQDKNRPQPGAMPTETQAYGGRNSLTSTYRLVRRSSKPMPAIRISPDPNRLLAAIASSCRRV
jgi:hypothetical protein